MHPDHAGGAELLKTKDWGAEIVTVAHYKPWYNGVTGNVGHIHDLLLTYYVANRLG